MDNRPLGRLDDFSKRLAFGIGCLPRLWQVLRTEGPAILAKKLRRRLATTPWRVRRRAYVVDAAERPGLLEFCPGDTPDISIVIPVFNRFRYTYNCLAALARLEPSRSFEIVVVDDCSTDDTRLLETHCRGIRVLRHSENLGFVRSVNRGASAARGKLLVFLNNDTQVQPGWLHHLSATFDRMPDAGLVGSRLIYPDGRLQEAGAILFADGSAWNYGQLDDPARPEYSYLREVDYCSGAALAIRKGLFDTLGGFDLRYVPGYYEDADLAMRVRAAGLRVYYQPLAATVHYEGVTAGTDRGAIQGMKRFQEINRQRFLDRWRPALAGLGARGDDLERVKERRVGQRALIVDKYMLTPDRESGSVRMSNLLTVLQGLGFKVTFTALNLEAPEPYTSQLQGRGIECLYRPHVRSLATWLANRGDLYDLVILSRADCATAVMPQARRYCRNARILFDTVDLHFLREARLAELDGNRSSHALATRRKRQELDLVDAADATLVVSQVELALLRSERPQARIYCVSNVQQAQGAADGFRERRDLLFIGAFAHPPNADAVRWLARDILPLIRDSLPDLRCHIIGPDPPPDIRALADANLLVHGYIADVAGYFRGCRLSVAPLRYGAGVKGKINQSLAYGLPVVATRVGVEGMHLVDGESALVADTAADFASAVVSVYTDGDLWSRLAAGGRSVAERHFGFEAARRALAEAIGA